MARSEIPLQLSGATKRFGGFTAVRDLSFEVPQGSVVGFLGPNGAGKSTSLRVALGIMSPDEGEARLFGAPPRLETLRRVGFLPEERGLYKKMNARSTIAYFARLKGLTSKEAFRRADTLLESTGLGPFGRSPISKLSKGMAQKVQILSTLAHEPELLILDEPFSGLDPVNQTVLEDLIIAQHERGATILFSTHVMEHAERLCDRIVMMARGRKVFDGTTGEAMATLGKAVRIGIKGPADVAAALAGISRDVTAEGDPDAGGVSWWRVVVPADRDGQDVLQAALAAQLPIAGFLPEQARLRDVFVSLVTEAEAKELDAPKAKAEAAHA